MFLFFQELKEQEQNALSCNTKQAYQAQAGEQPTPIMEPRLKTFLVQNGLNMAVKPLIDVGVDTACAIEFIDDDVVEIMRSEHALPLVTAKMLKAKLPLILEFASTRTNHISADDMADALAEKAGSVQHENSEVMPDTMPHHKFADNDDPQKKLSDTEAGLLQRCAQETPKKNHFEMDCTGNLCVENAMQGADAAGEKKLESHSNIGNAMQNAGAAGENEFEFCIDEESAGAAGGNELDLRIEKESAGAAGENELDSMNSQKDKESAGAAGEIELDALHYRSDKQSSTQGDVLRKKRTARCLVSEKQGYQCPKFTKFFYSSSKQTVLANKTRHINACNGLKSISRNASGSSQSSQTDRAEKKRSFLVHKALQAGCDATEDQTETELISYAQCLLNLSQRCEAQKHEKRGRFEAPLTLRHYTTSEENECCRSIGQKFMIDPGSIFELNKKRYRGFKTIDTRLKAGTDIIITAERGD